MSRETQIKVITYEEERLNYFTDLMKKSIERYKRLFKKFKDAPMLSAESEALSDAGREAQFHGDVVEMLENGYRKQSEGEWYKIEGFPRHHFCRRCGKGYRTKHNFCPNCGAKMKGGE